MFCRLLTLLLNWDPYSCLLLYTQWRARCFSPFLPSLDIFSFWQCRCSFRPLLGYHLQASQCTRSLHKSPLISTAMPWVGMTWTFQISTLENRKSKPREADSSHESPEENSMCLPELLGTPLIISAGVGGPCVSSVRCALLAVWWDRGCSLGAFLPGMLMSLVILNWRVQAPDSRLWIKRNVRHLEGTMKDQPLASLTTVAVVPQGEEGGRLGQRAAENESVSHGGTLVTLDCSSLKCQPALHRMMDDAPPHRYTSKPCLMQWKW